MTDNYLIRSLRHLGRLMASAKLLLRRSYYPWTVNLAEATPRLLPTRLLRLRSRSRNYHRSSRRVERHHRLRQLRESGRTEGSLDLHHRLCPEARTTTLGDLVSCLHYRHRLRSEMAKAYQALPPRLPRRTTPFQRLRLFSRRTRQSLPSLVHHQNEWLPSLSHL